ncbi:hypothetical protein FRB90_001401 [Tulasnella sp. 427]|nr:hypothetical protein FRB90_001401 [Tulasnella sp. 427]
MLSLAEFLRTTGPEDVPELRKRTCVPPIPVKMSVPPPKPLLPPAAPLEAVHDANAALQDLVTAMLTRSDSQNSLDVLSQWSSPSSTVNLSPEVRAADFLDHVSWSYISPPAKISTTSSRDELLMRSKRSNSGASQSTITSTGSSEDTLWDPSSPSKTSQTSPSIDVEAEDHDDDDSVGLSPSPSTPTRRPKTADHATLLALSAKQKQSEGLPIPKRPVTATSLPREKAWRHGTFIARNMMSKDELGRPRLDDELNRLACASYL